MSMDNFVKQMIADEVAKLKDDITKELLTKFDRTLDAVEAAEHLGISTKLLYDMCKQKRIPHIRLGSVGSSRARVKFKLSHLETWLEEQTVK